MKRRFSLCLIFVLLFTTAFGTVSCTEEPDAEPEGGEVYTSRVQYANSRMCVYGDYIYQIMKEEIYRYRRSTCERVSGCMDLECAGDCLLHHATGLYGIRENRLYFSATVTEFLEDGEGVEKIETGYFAYQNLHNGEVYVIRSCVGNENTGHQGLWINGDDMYYVVGKLKDGGDKSDPGDYWPTICRISLNGGEEEALFPLTEYSESPLWFFDDTLITMCGGVICGYDPETGARKEIFHYEKEGFPVRPMNYGELDGKMYFLLRTGSFLSDENGRTYEQFLYELDLATGEWRRLLDDPIGLFTVMNDGIYYSKAKIRAVSYGSDGESDTFYTSAELYACDLDGKNERVVYTNEVLPITNTAYFVIDNVYYGWVRLTEWNNEEGHNGLAFRKIDLTTGEIIAPINLFEE